MARIDFKQYIAPDDTKKNHRLAIQAKRG
jgi:hypothetical protein